MIFKRSLRLAAATGAGAGVVVTLIWPFGLHVDCGPRTVPTNCATASPVSTVRIELLFSTRL